MKILLCVLLFQYVYAQAEFGRSYLKNSRICNGWNCINNKLGLPDALPPREQYTVVLRGLLPDGAWQNVVERTLDGCYGNRTRRYTNTCPGQALAHCVVDQLIENCPAESLKIKDGCSPVTSLAGLKYMYSQSRYYDLEDNLLKDRRPEWFLKHYFSTKCCDLPDIFDLSTLTQCGFTETIHTYAHAPQLDSNFFALPRNTLVMSTPASVRTTPSSSGTKVNVVNLNDIQTTTEIVTDEVHLDPLECCDMGEFIKPLFREECHFELSWQGQNRLVINNNSDQITTETPITTSRPVSRPKEVYITPQTCDKETCVFRKLNIISDTGAVDREAYLKFLDNFTTAHPAWIKAKARVVTTCLTKPLVEYDAECEINTFLACTFDVLTENCPFKTKNGSCKHHRDQHTTEFCQISTSKYRPKNRRQLCSIPNFVDNEVLSSCGIDDITVIKYTTEARANKPTKSSLWMDKYMCKNLTPSTTCLLNKIGVLNKYGFMDYFKMKDTIRQFTINQPDWSHLQQDYLSAFMNMPLYREHCNSAKKFLNILDSMFLTCPASKKKTTPQCTKLFNQISNTIPDNLEKVNQIIKHFHHVFMPQEPVPTYSGPFTQRQHSRKLKKNPTYDYGILNSQMAPPVNIIDVKPEVKRPLLLLPVYLRLPNDKRAVIRQINNDGIWRSQPFWLHNQIAQAHMNSNATPVVTEPSISSSSVSTTK
ncbi:hypothetical protein K1T71_001091 [Dendrolimus kikuchii]|uniref:Uncharacterized protein n=1 Tax=Dendrolimus kikuchii TaxID=765133 RepID=A0ACC1DH23_9NEOP|nr:hypothetical protein K1T71_001091 [Dendrolimus kikuchii]